MSPATGSGRRGRLLGGRRRTGDRRPRVDRRRGAEPKTVVVGADDEDGEARRGVAMVAPGMAGAVLDDGVARPQVDLDAVVELEPHFTVEDHLEVDRRRRVHAGCVRLHVPCQPGECRLELGECALEVVDPLTSPSASWRHAEQPEAEAADRWEVGAVVRLLAGIREAGVASPPHRRWNSAPGNSAGGSRRPLRHWRRRPCRRRRDRHHPAYSHGRRSYACEPAAAILWRIYRQKSSVDRDSKPVCRASIGRRRWR